MTEKIPAPLLAKLERLESTYDAQWFIDLRDAENRSADVFSLPGYVGPLASTYGSQVTIRQALAWVCQNHHRDAKILFSAHALDADNKWPGCYDAPSLAISNNRVFSDRFEKELLDAQADWDGLSLDLRFITKEMLETLESLQDYPCLDESDWSQLEVEQQQEAFESYLASDWQDVLKERIEDLDPDLEDPENGPDSWDLAHSDKSVELFWALERDSGLYWEEQTSGWSSSGWWFDFRALAIAVELEDVKDLQAAMQTA